MEQWPRTGATRGRGSFRAQNKDLSPTIPALFHFNPSTLDTSLLTLNFCHWSAIWSFPHQNANKAHHHQWKYLSIIFSMISFFLVQLHLSPCLSRSTLSLLPKYSMFYSTYFHLFVNIESLNLSFKPNWLGCHLIVLLYLCDTSCAFKKWS